MIMDIQSDEAQAAPRRHFEFDSPKKQIVLKLMLSEILLFASRCNRQEKLKHKGGKTQEYTGKPSS